MKLRNQVLPLPYSTILAAKNTDTLGLIADYKNEESDLGELA